MAETRKGTMAECGAAFPAAEAAELPVPEKTRRRIAALRRTAGQAMNGAAYVRLAAPFATELDADVRQAALREMSRTLEDSAWGMEAAAENLLALYSARGHSGPDGCLPR